MSQYPNQLYFIKHSSVHDAFPYQIGPYMAELKHMGAKTFKTRLNGWENQPEVAGFTGVDPEEVVERLQGVFPEFESFGPIIHTIDWDFKLSDEDYLRHAGLICPYCLNNDITADGIPEMDGVSGFMKIVCNNCEREWKDVYQLTGWDEMYIYSQEE